MDSNRIARELVKLARSLVAGCCETAFEWEAGEGSVQGDAIVFPLVKFSMDYDTVLEHHQDFQGYIGTRRLNQIFEAELPDIVRHAMLPDYGGEISCTYSKCELYDSAPYRAFVYDLEIRPVSGALEGLAEALDNRGMMKAE